MSDGADQQDSSSLVEEELCGDLEPSVDGEPRVVLQETCTVPCPGKRRRGGEEETGGEERVRFRWLREEQLVLALQT